MFISHTGEIQTNHSSSTTNFSSDSNFSSDTGTTISGENKNNNDNNHHHSTFRSMRREMSQGNQKMSDDDHHHNQNSRSSHHHTVTFATGIAEATNSTAEEHQLLLQEVTDLKQQMEARDLSFRNDMVREQRRREILESNLRRDFEMTHNGNRSIRFDGSIINSLGADDKKHQLQPILMTGGESSLGDSELMGGGDEESAPVPSSRADTRAFAGIALNPSRSLHPKKNTTKFSAVAENYLDRSSKSDGDSNIPIKNKKGPAGDNPTNSDHDDEVNGIDIPLLPHDTFSYLAFSKFKSVSLLLSIFVIGVQVLTLTVLCLDTFAKGTPGNPLGIPTGINPSTATIQVVAIFIITVGQTDLHDSLNTLFVGYQEYELTKNIGRPIKYWRWALSLWVRITITLYALVVTLLMICTEADTTQVLLDFTSIEFITNLDNIFFWLTAYGYFGFMAQRDATIILNASPSAIVLTLSDNEDGDATHKKSSRSLGVRSESTELGIAPMRKRRFPRFLFTAFLFVMMLTGWGIIFSMIRRGKFLCQTIFVQFSDDFNPELAPFTGLYKSGCSNQVSGCLRSKYGEVSHGNYTGTAKFDYCVEESAWEFTFGNDPGDVEAGKTSACKGKARSKIVHVKTQDSYDIMGTASNSWQVVNSRGTLVPMDGFQLRCFDCTNDPNFCGGPDRGNCVNNRCVCDPGWYGRRCEFFEPCEKIEFTDLELQEVDGRKFATQYDLLYKDNGERVDIYDRPVYQGINDGVGDEESRSNQVFFNGRRWVLTTNLEEIKNETFHGYWSAKWNRYSVDFYSAEVQVDGPEDSTSPDGLAWFRAKVLQPGSQVVPGVLTSQSERSFRFLCATCSNKTNPCLYNGLCQQNKTCDCISGSSGRLCQVLPTGNGHCDDFFNSREFGYDGGDCCKQTCVSTEVQDCGRDIVTNSQGVETIGFVGFKNCRDPSVARSVSGSRTIYDIQQRGVLNCGTIFTTTWFYNFMADQCRAVAASVLNDPNAIELFNFTSDRFTGLRDKRFDIVFWTDYTANRDVYEASSKSAFNYATVPYYFGGFIFAGISPFGTCADNGDFFSAQCLDIKICLVGGTTWFDTASKVFPSESMITYKSFEETVVGLENGECNVIGGSQFDVELIAIRQFGYTGAEANYEVGSKRYAKSFESWVTRPDDRVWSRFTSWVFESLVQAAESNITQATNGLMGTTDVFGTEFSNMFQNAVGAVGNYGEMWERNLPFTRNGMNLVNDGTTGAMISFDFGRVMDQGPELSRNSVIRTIITRGFLICGVTGESVGFGNYDDATDTWSGFDIDLCRGIAAALFDGDDTKLDIREVSSINRFSKIESGDVDIVSGATRTLDREVNFGVNDGAFDFSPVYFYDGMIFAGQMPYAFCAENQELSNVNGLGFNCTGTKICVTNGSTWLNAILKTMKIPLDNIILTTHFEESMQLHVAGSCNVIAGETGKLNVPSLRAAGYVVPEDYYIGTKKLTKEPICLMHRSDDQHFSDLIKWVVFGFFYAEENEITSVNFFDMPQTNLFGPDFTKIWQNSIRKVGNYAQIYGRHIGEAFPRTGMNLLNDLSSPQLFAAPGTI